MQDRSNIKKPLCYDSSAFFTVESNSVDLKEAAESQKSEN